MKRGLGKKGLAGLVLGAALTGGATVFQARREVKRLRATPAAGPQGDRLFTPPTDVTHHHVPSHDGGTLHVVERGAGRPLVLLHGITLRWDVWSPQLHQLADRYRVIACDLRGHGQSEAGEEGFGLGRLAADLATVLTDLDLSDAILVGHSMGGMTAMRFCADFPGVLDERVTGLMLVATAATIPMPAPVKALLSRPGQRLLDRVESGRAVRQYAMGDNALSLLVCRLAFGAHPPGAAVAQVRSMVEAVPQASSLPSGVGLLEHDARQSLAAVRTPTIVVVGNRDLLTPVWSARLIARLLPGAELHILAGAGHQVMQERPDELAMLIDQLADRTSEPTVSASAGPTEDGAAAGLTA